MEVINISIVSKSNIITPYGNTDNVMLINLDSVSDAYILDNVINSPVTCTFSIWHRSESDSKITFNILGLTETVSSTPQWSKYVKTVTTEEIKENIICIIPNLNINSYLYEGYLTEGIVDTSWLPAPEDIQSEFNSVRSELVQTENSILLKISNSNGEISSLKTSLGEIKAEISDAKGSSTTLKARLDGIDTSIIDAEKNSKSFATQEAERIQSTVTQEYQGSIAAVESNFTQRADSIEERVETAEGIIASHSTSIGEISDTVQDNLGNITKIQQSLNGVETEIENARGDKTTLSAKIGEISQSVSDVNGKYSALSSTVDGVAINVGSLQEMINQSFEFTDEGLIIKSSGTGNSNISLKLGNDRISFLDGTNEVAYISNNKLHITSASIVDSLQIGRFGFTPISNGSLSFNKLF